MNGIGIGFCLIFLAWLYWRLANPRKKKDRFGGDASGRPGLFVLLIVASSIFLCFSAVARDLTEGEKIAYQAGFENGRREARIEALREEQKAVAQQAIDLIGKTTGTLQTTHTAQRAAVKPKVLKKQ